MTHVKTGKRFSDSLSFSPTYTLDILCTVLGKFQLSLSFSSQLLLRFSKEEEADMNRISIVLGAVAAFSLVFAGLHFHGLLDTIFEIPRRNDEEDDHSSLEQDLQDILGILPLTEMRLVVDNYARHDKQINDTVTFLNDQKRFICQEAKNIPHIQLFIFAAKELGLNLDHWTKDFKRFWKSLPVFTESKFQIERRGLTGMISQILSLVPKEEMHALLCSKIKESKSFRTFLLLLKSQQFYDLCKSIQTSAVLQRHFHWAKESGIEVIFAVELFGDLYVYLTQEVA